MNRTIMPALLLLAFIGMEAAADPIVIRHDRSDAAYRALGERYATTLCLVKVPDGDGYVVAEGTMIDTQWVLTAAHVARHVHPGHILQVAGQATVVRQVILHPSWREQEHDLALIALEEPVESAVPLPLYRNSDEIGQEIIVVGRGGFGTGQTGPTSDDGILRGGTNRIDDAGAGWLSFVFDAPDMPNTTDLEAISGPGDSGGPGIILVEGTPYLAGISSGQDDAATGRPGIYGVTEYYTRVSYYASWIDRTMATVSDLASGSAIAAAKVCNRDRGLSNSPEERRAAALLNAICQADATVHRTFIEDHFDTSLREKFSMEEHLGFFRRMHADLGDPSVVQIRQSGSYSLVLVVQGASEQLLELTLTFDEAPPHRIIGLVIEAGRRAGTGSLKPSENGSLDDVDRQLLQQAEAETFSGVVLIARNGDILFEKAYGWANKQAGVANTPNTRFNIGSINKLFTAVAVLQLAEQERLDLDAPLATYLSGFPPEVAERVTVRHLLQHRSGWGHYWDHPQFLANKEQLQSLDDYLDFIHTIPLDFEPGAQEQYSNAGYEVLGGIIERVSGQSYYDYVREHIYEPAGMTGSDSFRRDVAGLAVGYVQQTASGYTQTNTDLLAPRGTAAGGGYATARDLLRFEQALLGHRLLTPRSTMLLLNQFEPAENQRPEGAIGFGGGAPGVSAVWEKQFDSGYTVIVLSNFSPPTAEQIAQTILGTVRLIP